MTLKPLERWVPALGESRLYGGVSSCKSREVLCVSRLTIDCLSKQQPVSLFDFCVSQSDSPFSTAGDPPPPTPTATNDDQQMLLTPRCQPIRIAPISS